MANRTKVLETLRSYFETKGRVLKAQEYAREIDTPIRLQQVKNIFGSWNRMEKYIMARGDDTAITDIDDVLDARNRAAAAAEAAWKEASENQDKKAYREAQAQVVAEKLALNAATPEGANANKIAIGGPLPGEQPRYETTGATVNVDPVTKVRTVVDPEPELITTIVENPKTPVELKAAAEADALAGNVKTGDETSGGSQGSASIATVAALDTTEQSDEGENKAAKEAPKKDDSTVKNAPSAKK